MSIKNLIRREIKSSHPDLKSNKRSILICKESAQFPARLCYIMSHTLLIYIAGKT